MLITRWLLVSAPVLVDYYHICFSYKISLCSFCSRWYNILELKYAVVPNPRGKKGRKSHGRFFNDKMKN